MKLITSTPFFLFAVLTAAQSWIPKYPVSGDVVISEAKKTCGEAKLECCNKATYKDDLFSAEELYGPYGSVLPDVLRTAAQGGAGHEGLGYFDTCSEIMSLPSLQEDGPVRDMCKQNIACCENREEYTFNEHDPYRCVDLGTLEK